MTMQFGELKDVDLRVAWPNEARDFTPWLADNLERLGQVIGIPMELEGSEVKVEQFSADILARDSTDDSLILIENQLESTDHSHLGQILTYLAGLNAQTIIWVAKDFREAHLSAIRWLNQHTTDPFAFFAVQVRVVRIGDDNSSPVAPLFEVLERPSHEESGWSEERKFRYDFWKFYHQTYPEDRIVRPLHSDSGAQYSVSDVQISLYLALREVGIYIRPRPGDKRESTAQRILSISAALKGDDVGDAVSGNRHHGTVRKLSVDSHNRDNWPQIVEWMHEQLHKYIDVLMAEEETIGLEIIESIPTES